MYALQRAILITTTEEALKPRPVKMQGSEESPLGRKRKLPEANFSSF